MRRVFKWHVDSPIEPILELVKDEWKAEMRDYLSQAKKLHHKTEACKIYYLLPSRFKD